MLSEGFLCLLVGWKHGVQVYIAKDLLAVYKDVGSGTEEGNIDINGAKDAAKIMWLWIRNTPDSPHHRTQTNNFGSQSVEAVLLLTIILFSRCKQANTASPAKMRKTAAV